MWGTKSRREFMADEKIQNNGTTVTVDGAPENLVRITFLPENKTVEF